MRGKEKLREKPTISEWETYSSSNTRRLRLRLEEAECFLIGRGDDDNDDDVEYLPEAWETDVNV